MTGSIVYRQSIQAMAFLAPSLPGQAPTDFDFQIQPPENVENDSYSNDSSGRYNLPASGSESVCFGTVGVASVLVLQPVNDILIQFVNSIALTGTIANGSAVVSSVSSVAGLQIGQPVSGVGIPADTTIISIAAGTFTMSADATADTAALAITATATTQPLYFNGGQSSVVNVDFTGLILTNPNLTLAATGKFFLAGV